MLNMVISKARHGVIAVVVIWLEPNGDALLLTDRLGCLYEVFGQQLLLRVEVVASTLETIRRANMNKTGETYHIDQYVQLAATPLFQQFCRIVFGTFALPVLLTKIALECFLSPWSFERVRNWRKSTHTLILPRILQE